jgi:hypothetical protein
MTRGTDNAAIESDCWFAIPDVKVASTRLNRHPQSQVKTMLESQPANTLSENEAPTATLAPIHFVAAFALIACVYVVYSRQERKYQPIKSFSFSG